MTHRTWKLATFLIGLAILFAGAIEGSFPDWSLGVSLWMAGWTLLTAEWVVGVLMARDWHRMPVALIAAWWCVDGCYVAYWQVVNPAVIIREQWMASLCLYLLAGFVWRNPPKTWRMG